MSKVVTLVCAVALLAAACGDDGNQSSETPQPATTAAPATTVAPAPDPAPTRPPVEVPLGGPAVTASVADAIAMNLASNGADHPVVIWSTTDSVMLAEFDLDAGVLGTPSSVSGDVKPASHPIERPAVGRSSDGTIWVAFTAREGAGGSVYLTTRGEGSVSAGPDLLSGPAQPETNLVNMALETKEGPILSWLEDSTLSVATPGPDGVPVEHEEVDDLTCDCCDSAPIVVGDNLVVGYRNLEHSSQGAIRDVYAVTSPLAESRFAEPVAVADDHWYLDGCPFSGPSAVALDGVLVVAWMDARQSVHPNQSGSTIWVDRSRDGAATFGVDLAITSEGIHRSPRLAADSSGTLHLVWQTQSPDRGIFYATSEDQGASFSDPILLVSAGDEGAVPGNPSLVVHQNLIVMTWVDSAGGHVGAWEMR